MARYDRTSLKRKRGKGPLALSTRLGRQHARVMARTKLGSGERFRSLKAKLARKPGVKTPGALAAWIGRKVYGKRRFQKMAAAGRRRAR